jgi:hypothetical protein
MTRKVRIEYAIVSSDWLSDEGWCIEVYVALDEAAGIALHVHFDHDAVEEWCNLMGYEVTS